MRKIFIVLALFLSVNSVFGQVQRYANGTKDAPTVQIDVQTINGTSADVHFIPSGNCAKYHVMRDTAGGLEHWLNMGVAPDLQTVVKQWGIHLEGEKTETFVDMIPDYDYVIYAAPEDAEGNLYPVIIDSVHTPALGGEGTSIIELEVNSIADSSVRLLAAPNDQTKMYHAGLAAKELVEQVGLDSVAKIIFADPYPLYDNDDHVWVELEPNTDYYAIGLGINANDEFGEIATLQFKTLETIAIEMVESKAEIKIYPLPNNGCFNVENVEPNEKIYIYDVNGNCVHQEVLKSTGTRIDVSELPDGNYLLKTKNNKAVKFIIKK